MMHPSQPGSSMFFSNHCRYILPPAPYLVNGGQDMCIYPFCYSLVGIEACVYMHGGHATLPTDCNLCSLSCVSTTITHLQSSCHGTSVIIDSNHMSLCIKIRRINSSVMSHGPGRNIGLSGYAR